MSSKEVPADEVSEPTPTASQENLKALKFIVAVHALIIVALYRAADRSGLWKEFWITSVYCTAAAIVVYFLLRKNDAGKINQ